MRLPRDLTGAQLIHALALRIGTLAAILAAVAESRGITREELLRELFG